MLDFLTAEFLWTDEKVNRLKDGWGNGRSQSQIAEDIGCSRNAIASKISRLRRGEFAASLPARTTGAKSGAPRKRGDQGGGALKAIRRNREMPLMAAQKMPDYVPALASLCLLLDLKPGQCRFPLDRDGQRLFCGAPQSAPDSKLNSYCAFHHRITHQSIDRAKARSTFQFYEKGGTRMDP